MMKKFALYHLLVVLLLGGFASGCKDDDYFARPASLEPPIYEQLKTRGNFTNYLACVDRVGFTENLSKTGYYTVFAPTDAAFETYLKGKNLTSVNELDSITAKAIVAYSLISGVSTKDQLDDIQFSTGAIADIYRDMAFKRETYAYKWVSSYAPYNSSVIDATDVNSMGGPMSPGFNSDVFNKKFIPFFTPNFMATRNLETSDYNFFFPGVTLSDINLVDATVIETDNYAENGIFHVVDKVIEPLKNLEELLADDANCSEFKAILERYFTDVTVKAPEAFLLKYQQARGERKDIYIKGYPDLVFSPNCEKFIGTSVYNSQYDGFTLFAPTNEALQTFFAERFFKDGYDSLAQMPNFVIAELVNAHMWYTSAWPSKFEVTQNYFGEEARFDPNADVVSAKMGSNGLYYSVSKVQATNAFSTVLGDILLNPDYSMMYQALVSTQNQYILKNPDTNVKVFLISNDQFKKYGLTYNNGTNAWELNNPDWTGLSATVALDRLINLHILLDQDVDFSAGKWGVVKTYGGELMRYHCTTTDKYVWSSGNALALGTLPKIRKTNAETENGYSFVTIDDVPSTVESTLSFSNLNIGDLLSTNTNYRAFYNYLDKSCKSKVEGGEGELSRFVYNPDTKAISNVLSTDEQTFLIPNATAIAKAVTEGYLPKITVSDFTQAEQELLLKFVQHHILKKMIVVPNGGYNGPAYTHYKTADGETYVTIDSSTPNKLIVTDAQGKLSTATAAALSNSTNMLANRSVVHLIDNFLRY